MNPTSLPVSYLVGRGEELAGQRGTGAGDAPAVRLVGAGDGCAGAHDGAAPAHCEAPDRGQDKVAVLQPFSSRAPLPHAW